MFGKDKSEERVLGCLIRPHESLPKRAKEL